MEQSNSENQAYVPKPGEIQGGRTTGVVEAPLSVVWASAQDFFDLSWWSSNFIITKDTSDPTKDTRIVKFDLTLAKETLIKKVESETLCAHVYTVEILERP